MRALRPPPRTLAIVQVYGNAFSPDSGRCFRWVYRDDTTQPMRCPGQVATRGWFRDGRGVWWAVDACAEHAEPVGRSRPGPGARFGVVAGRTTSTGRTRGRFKSAA